VVFWGYNNIALGESCVFLSLFARGDLGSGSISAISRSCTFWVVFDRLVV